MKTHNYDIFKISKKNRPIMNRHVKTLAESIKRHGYFYSKPITVTPDFVITDGQHRYMACKELNYPIVYEIDNIDENESMVILNSTSSNWTLKEFIHHYAERNIKFYVDLKEFMQTNTILHQSATIDIYIGDNSSSQAKKIRKGEPMTVNKNLNETLDLVLFFKDKLNFWDSTHFVRALINFVSSSEKKYIDKLKKNAFGIIQCAKVEQYITMFNKLTRKKIK
jgi:hypothetical protein